MRRTKSVTLACLMSGLALVGCGGGGGGVSEKSAADLLDEANARMEELSSLTIKITNTVGDDQVTWRMTTDLKNRCQVKNTFSASGTLEQIRIGETDYVRPDKAYLETWSGNDLGAARPGKWAKVPVAESKPGGGLSQCTRPFESFGTATKGEATRIDGREALGLRVTDPSDKEGTYTFYVATEGEPYLLKAVYKGGEGGKQLTTTSFSDFDEPLDIRPPASTEVLDMGESKD
ncbi:hypothetical protein C5F59_030640 [Streptomyces sp. QL37]|uniref:hypothetical protein n=1 Tax=Streptomyces sp. QL37 TaxID=2093747 RepID=UPI000CF2F405|nr:hypothetical protein [Streptomyces sp. QL37]PPQ60629.1 hypothetical protein C5F59_31110 [Streptomyces sp. QL37]